MIDGAFDMQGQIWHQTPSKGGAARESGLISGESIPVQGVSDYREVKTMPCGSNEIPRTPLKLADFERNVKKIFNVVTFSDDELKRSLLANDSELFAMYRKYLSEYGVRYGDKSIREQAALLYHKNSKLYGRLQTLSERDAKHIVSPLPAVALDYLRAKNYSGESTTFSPDALNWRKLPDSESLKDVDISWAREPEIEVSPDLYLEDQLATASQEHQCKGESSKSGRVGKVSFSMPKLFEPGHVPSVEEIRDLACTLDIEEALLDATDEKAAVEAGVSGLGWDNSCIFADEIIRPLRDKLFQEDGKEQLIKRLKEVPEIAQWLVNICDEQNKNPTCKALQLTCLWQDWEVACIYDQTPDVGKKDIHSVCWRTIAKDVVNSLDKGKRKKENRKRVRIRYAEDSFPATKVERLEKQNKELKREKKQQGAIIKSLRNGLKEATEYSETVDRVFERLESDIKLAYDMYEGNDDEKQAAMADPRSKVIWKRLKEHYRIVPEQESPEEGVKG